MSLFARLFTSSRSLFRIGAMSFFSFCMLGSAAFAQAMTPGGNVSTWLHPGTVGTAYAMPAPTMDVGGSYQWYVSGGMLPVGINLNPMTG